MTKIFGCFMVITWLLCMSLATFAQESLNLKIKKYIRENIRPELQKLRSQLDPVLTRDEKKDIVNLRWQFREIMKAAKQEDFETAWKTNENQPKSLDIEMLFFQNNQQLIQVILEDAWTLAENHIEKINELLGQLEPTREKWWDDLNAIIQKNSNTGQERISIDTELFENHFGSDFFPIFFLLWGPEGLIYDHNQMDNPNLLKVNTYYNAATDIMNLQFTLEQPTTIELLLVDGQGRGIHRFEYKYSVSGIYTETIDIKSLATGRWFMKVVSPQGTRLISFDKI
ncbi:MAG: hypothetical protein O7F74_03330 [Bacteroidetes bacterium]|nr:hypothetical protein [Bacteroidota bacterium]